MNQSTIFVTVKTSDLNQFNHDLWFEDIFKVQQIQQALDNLLVTLNILCTFRLTDITDCRSDCPIRLCIVRRKGIVLKPKEW